jgi:hypothetical protein
LNQNRYVNIRVSTFSATTLLICRPLELFTRALLAKVTGKGLDLQEAQEGEELSNPVLHGGAGQAPLV